MLTNNAIIGKIFQYGLFWSVPNRAERFENPVAVAMGTVFGESIIKGGAIDVRNYQNRRQAIPR